MEPHAEDAGSVVKRLGSGEKGLTAATARARLEEWGPNSFALEKPVSPAAIFISQFKNVLVVLLLIAAAVSFALSYLDPHEGGYIDSLLIAAIVVANAVFGFLQEYKAERSIEALAKMASPRATVLRDGKEEDIPSEEVVPGDMILLNEGDKVPADGRLVECFSFYADESSLTGESVPSSKNATALKPETPLAERSNMVYMNSVVTRGRASAVVVGTGLRTEVGKIAKEISEAPQKVTRFQVEIEDLGRKVSMLTLGILVVIAVSEFLLRTGDLLFIFTAAVALGVAAIPEGLPAVVTLALSIATSRMLGQNALMRRLSTVQDLGSVDVICTDKTGTLTENVMTVTRIYLDSSSYAVGGKGLDKKGEIRPSGEAAHIPRPGGLERLLTCAALCNDAREAEGKFKGDPTEIALLIPAYKAGMDVAGVRAAYKRIDEVSFSSDRKMMSTQNTDGKSFCVFAKGAPEMILQACDRIMEGGKSRKLTDADREELLGHNKSMASDALRVLAMAYKEGPKRFPQERMEGGLVFLGLMGMKDPPRTGVREAVADCRSAGIRVIMVTGDNRYTAEAIGRELGFSGPGISGEELDRMSGEELAATVEKADIYARTSPRHKVMLLKALKANNHIVSMTGDGVNDAAAIKNSDVGIAMGIRGTEVTKQASDIIILDDNFITIRNAIAEGRATFDNIRKFVVYLLGANLSEVFIVAIASLTALGISPKIAVQLLWINLVTDGLPAIALGVDPPGKGIMKRKPRRKDERIIDRDTLYFLVSIGVCASAALLALYYVALSSGDTVRAQTLLFTEFVVMEMGIVYAVRWRYRYSMMANKWLHMSVGLSIALQFVLLYSPLGAFFGTVPLTLADWDEIAAAIAGFLILLAIAMKAEPLIIRPSGQHL